MTRNVTGWALGLCVALSLVISSAARGGGDVSPSTDNEHPDQERATVAARKTKAAPAPAPAISDPEAYERELQAAKEQRDKELKEAAKETDRRRFEKRKEEIFARYAAIVAE